MTQVVKKVVKINRGFSGKRKNLVKHALGEVAEWPIAPDC